MLQFFSLLTVGLLVCIDQLIKIIIKLSWNRFKMCL